MVDFEILSQSVISGKQEQVKEQVKAMLDVGVPPLDIINQGLIAGMNIVGPRFKKGDMYVPEVLMSAKAMAAGMELVKPLISGNDLKPLGVILLGTVKGDLHDIGKNLVGMLLGSGGFTVINLGVDIDPDKFVEAVKTHNVDILAMSALLTTTMFKMKDTIELLQEEGLRDKVKVIIGGAPISQDFADQIGADGFASDAASAVDLCKKVMKI